MASPGNPFRTWRCALVAGAIASACCVRPPLTEEWLAVGFREPKQAVDTFQTAVRADSADLEYRCFSAGFRQRNQISKLTWLEARQELRRRWSWLRLGISDMALEGEIVGVGRHVEGTWVTHGRPIKIALVREDYAELWSGGKLLSDDAGVDFEKHTLVQRDAEGSEYFYGWAVIPFGPENPPVTEVHVGSEWKIDGFETFEDEGDAAGGKSPTRQEPQ